ncbi:hypothetical protein AURDEDRAFT_126698 [Auricularia subglabra TFB-10046 SS5]|nr:hypothetical protein AURDEDRAFT_126698 [Auricularia subglabra TFB-10046 SS5]
MGTHKKRVTAARKAAKAHRKEIPDKNRKYTGNRDGHVWPWWAERPFDQCERPPGQNQWIADDIYRKTGLRRTAIQVRSHLQVRKNWFKGFHGDSISWESFVVSRGLTEDQKSDEWEHSAACLAPAEVAPTAEAELVTVESGGDASQLASPDAAGDLLEAATPAVSIAADTLVADPAHIASLAGTYASIFDAVPSSTDYLCDPTGSTPGPLAVDYTTCPAVVSTPIIDLNAFHTSATQGPSQASHPALAPPSMEWLGFDGGLVATAYSALAYEPGYLFTDPTWDISNCSPNSQVGPALIVMDVASAKSVPVSDPFVPGAMQSPLYQHHMAHVQTGFDYAEPCSDYQIFEPFLGNSSVLY